MKSCTEYIDELAPSQREAARIGKNAVIAAGAGSGKTRVLAARYLHLVVERKIPPKEILALTFTKKAASEMYGRIYNTLQNASDPEAQEAVANFHEARITTIDSFCNSIARDACRRYGISPDFTIDAAQTSALARELALPFYLERRKSPAIRHLLRANTQQTIADELFAKTMIEHSPVSSPIDFAALFEAQSREISREFARVCGEIARTVDALEGLEGGTGNPWSEMKELIPCAPAIPEENDRDGIRELAAFLIKLTKIPFRAGKNEAVMEAKELIQEIKKKTLPDYLALANFLLNKEVIRETGSLLAEFQELFHREKRKRSLMTFADVSRLAVDALRDDHDLRKAVKESISSIMIDEFQDDNELQRNLLFLIAEKPDRCADGIPEPQDLKPEGLFFVGDEKQSIYRFRGADVSVFRALARDFAGEDTPALGTNYRTEAALIDTFNRIFPSVFLNPAFYTEQAFPLYEAEFSPIIAHRDTAGLSPRMEALLVRKDVFPENDPRCLSPHETEAAEVASRIQELVSLGTPVREEDGIRPCAWDDIAILFRSTTRQYLYERELRSRGIPYQAESLRGLFGDAPVNDLYAFLRLAVYPADDEAYAVVLRGPLAGISDLAVAEALMARRGGQQDAAGKTFPAELASRVSDNDAAGLSRLREIFEWLRENADRKPAAELVSHLWYDRGYRQVILEDPALHHYLELYDYFFELARTADAKGETLAVFLDRVAQMMANEIQVTDLDIPVERHGGVRLMTVHKSKGLEFPIVFLVDCGNQGREAGNSDAVYWSDAEGASINSGAPEDLPQAGSNWFYLKAKEEERLRTEAEIRRLLYVAMTRAETLLFASGVLSIGEEEEAAEPEEDSAHGTTVAGAEAREALPEAALIELVAAYFDKKETTAQKKGEKRRSRTFFDFLLKAWLAGPVEGAKLADIPPRMREARKATDRAQRTMLFKPEEIPESAYQKGPRERFAATALHGLSGDNAIAANPEGEQTTPQQSEPPADPIDALLDENGVTAAEFGTWAHRAIEARFLGLQAFLPEALAPALESMAARFLESPLGAEAAAAQWRESEYAFITRWELDDGSGGGKRSVSVSGQMDLVFDRGDAVVVVDYKTDRIEDPALHAEQLAVYRKAATDLRGKKAETWLFYLRSGNAVLVEG